MACSLGHLSFPSWYWSDSVYDFKAIDLVEDKAEKNSNFPPKKQLKTIELISLSHLLHPKNSLKTRMRKENLKWMKKNSRNNNFSSLKQNMPTNILTFKLIYIKILISKTRRRPFPHLKCQELLRWHSPRWWLRWIRAAPHQDTSGRNQCCHNYA